MVVEEKEKEVVVSKACDSVYLGKHVGHGLLLPREGREGEDRKREGKKEKWKVGKMERGNDDDDGDPLS